MGKKGKGNKLAKMSEEERARYLQMRADIEEEARRRKQQLLSLYMKNKLKREDCFCRLNMAKINQEWRSLLRQAKCDEQRDEMLEVEKCFKEALQRKERVIKRLFNDLDVAEDMYATLQQSHMETIDKFIGIHKQRMEFLKKSYERDCEIILKEYIEDFELFREFRKTAQDQLECVMFQLEDQHATELRLQHEKYMNCLDDAKSEIQHRLETITRSGEEKLERLWQEYQKVLSTYVKNTESFYAEYMDLKEREAEHTTTIKDYYREIELLTEQLSQIKMVATDVSEKCEANVNYLTRIRNKVSIKFRIKKDEIGAKIKTDEAHFKLMTVKSHEGLKYFEGILRKGEILLQLSMVCRKYETEREKILPWGLPPIAKRAFEEPDDELSNVPGELKDTTLDIWHLMEKFWKRVNNATVDIMSLKEEKRKLERENNRLKAHLREYLIDFNISNGSNLHVNDYKLARPCSMRVERVTQTLKPETSSMKSHSAKFNGNRRRMIGLGSGQSAADESKENIIGEVGGGGGGGSGGGSGCRHQPFVNIREANLTNVVRSKRLVRGQPLLAKIESSINCPERPQQNEPQRHRPWHRNRLTA